MSALTKDFIHFFESLSKNNDREWFLANKKNYETNVKKPFEALVGLLIDEMNKKDSSIQTTPGQAIFRIYRDVRFSKDKTPYKTFVSANVSRNGRRSTDIGYYLMIDAEKVTVGGGAYNLDKEQLKKVRNEIAYSGKEFRKIIENKKFKASFGELKGEKNKIIPKEFKEAYEQEELIANKQFYYMSEFKDKKLITSDGLSKFILDHFTQGLPFNEFIRRALED